MKLDRLTITLPWPDMSLMPNRKNGRSWKSTTKARDQARTAGYIAAHAVCRGFTAEGNVPLTITFAAPDKRHRDLDNLLSCAKHALDGVADALGVNDRQFRPIRIDAAVDNKKQGFVIVEIGI